MNTQGKGTVEFIFHCGGGIYSLQLISISYNSVFFKTPPSET